MISMREKAKEFAGDAPLLIEAGFVAIKQVDEDSARKCFLAAMVIDTENSLPVVGLGMLSLMKLDLDEAMRLFNVVLQKEPDNQMARTMLGIANLYRISKDGLHEGKELIEEAMDETDDSSIKDLCGYSKELHKEIKKKMKDLHPLESEQTKDIKKRLRD